MYKLQHRYLYSYKFSLTPTKDEIKKGLCGSLNYKRSKASICNVWKFLKKKIIGDANFVKFLPNSAIEKP